MTALERKLVRDLWQMRGQALAIVLVMACGVATFVMSLTTFAALDRTRSDYYAESRFADVFARLKRAPKSLIPRLEEIPGVAELETRVIADVTLDVPGVTEPAMGRLISLPDRGTPRLNRLHMRSGRGPESPQLDDVVVNEHFFEANQLQLGDQIPAVINGRRQLLRIVGVALSPEYIYPIRPGEFLPDYRRFAVFWSLETPLASAFDLEGAFNALELSLTPEAQVEEVIRRLDLLLEPFGSGGAYDRADQVSHRFISSEMAQLKNMSWIMPLIFLAAACFLLNIVFSRLVGSQREQIATLKAFGYSDLEVGWHYAQFTGALVLCGTVLGIIGGGLMARGLTELYSKFFRFPEFEYWLEPRIAIAALGVTATAAGIGTWTAIQRAVQLQPAEAMRPEPPPRYRTTLLERLGIQRWLTAETRMVVRRLERQPWPALMSCLGIALSEAVVILGAFITDGVDYVMDFQFYRAQRYDVLTSFVEPESASARYELAQLPGIEDVSPFRAVAARIRVGSRHRRQSVMGLDAEQRLYRLLDTGGREVPLPNDGLVVSQKLGQILHVGVGDLVRLELLDGSNKELQVPVAGLIRDFTEPGAYMDRRALNRLLEEGETMSGAFLAVSPVRADALYRELKEIPTVAGVSVKQATIESFKKTLAENLLVMRSFNLMFAIIIAGGAVYNCIRMTLAERSRELATLRVLGFTRSETASILLSELALITLAALPLGWLLGYGFAWEMVVSLDTETQRFPLVVQPATYAFAATVVLLAAVVSGLIVQRQLTKLDLLGVLKAQD